MPSRLFLLPQRRLVTNGRVCTLHARAEHSESPQMAKAALSIIASSLMVIAPLYLQLVQLVLYPFYNFIYAERPPAGPVIEGYKLLIVR